MITLRKLALDDLAACRELRLLGLRESATSFGSSHEEEAARGHDFYKDRIESTAERWVMAAFDEAGLVGVVGFVRDGGLKTRQRGFIWGMYVHPDWRRQSVGRNLLKTLLAEVEALRLDCVESDWR